MSYSDCYGFFYAFWGYRRLGFDGALIELWVGFVPYLSTIQSVVWICLEVNYIFLGSDWGYHSPTESILQPYFSHTWAILKPYTIPTWLLVNWLIGYLVNWLLNWSQQRKGGVDIAPVIFISFYLTTFGGTTAILQPYSWYTLAKFYFGLTRPIQLH